MIRKTMIQIADFAKKASVLVSAAALVLSINPTRCNAEKIYCKDGRSVTGKIAYRKKDVIWIKEAKGSIGIGVENIDRIENDDGSVSMYDYQALFKQIRAFIEEKRYPDAVDWCSRLLRNFPDDVEIHYLRGMLRQKTGDFAKAIEDYEFVVKRNAGDAKIFNNLGASFAKARKYEEAISWFKKAIERDAGMPEARKNLANALLESKDYKGAIEEYAKIIKSTPNDAEMLYNLGIAYLALGNRLGAREQWERVIVLKPDDVKAKKGLEYIESLKE